MSLHLSANSKEFETVPEGVYVGRCYKVIDLGTQAVTYAGVESYKRLVRVTWELLGGDLMIDGRPFSISKTYTQSLNEKANLAKDLVAWRGKPFSEEEKKDFYLKNVLGTYCQIQVLHKQRSDGDGFYPIVNAIMKYTGQPIPAVNDDIFWDFDFHDNATFGKLNQYDQDKLSTAQEWDDNIATATTTVTIEDLPDFPAETPGHSSARKKADELKERSK